MFLCLFFFFFFSSRRRHTRYWRDWSSDVCSSDLGKRRGREWRRRGVVGLASGLVRVRHGAALSCLSLPLSGGMKTGDVASPVPRRHCEERTRRSNPAFLSGPRWIASLALAMTSHKFRRRAKLGLSCPSQFVESGYLLRHARPCAGH